MALVNCPECGRENVSDSAESCPNCGYGVKAHFELIKKQEAEAELARQQKEAQEKYAQQQKETLIKLAQQEKERYNQRWAAIELPSNPTTSIEHKITICGSLASIIIGIVLLSKNFEGSPKGIILILLGVAALGIYYFTDYKEKAKLYRLSQDDPDAYRRTIIERENDYRQQLLKQEEATRRLQALQQSSYSVLKCPVCGSTTVDKISTLDRTVSVAAVGLASAKIGKQYKCRHCGHMW